MYKAQLFLIGILCAVSLRKFVGAEKVEQGHRDSRHDEDYRQRTKRYTTGRVPLSYLYNRADADDDNYAVDKRYRVNSIHTNPVASHFRELQVRQVKRPSPRAEDDRLLSPQMQLLQYAGRNGNNVDMDGDIDVDLEGFGEGPVVPQVAEVGGIGSSLSDSELQTLLLLLEEYRLQGKAGPPAIPLQNFYTPPAQYFTPEMEVAGMGMGKRETGKRTNRNRGPLVLEQPMSFENSLGGDGYPVFLNQKRSKRVGNTPLKKTVSSSRIKKETDPAAAADLEKIFAGASNTNQQAVISHSLHQSTSIPTTAIATNQIPPPSSIQKKPKKSIDWSDYFGVDKRQDNHKQTTQRTESHSNSQSADQEQAMHVQNSSEKQDKPTSITVIPPAVVSAKVATHAQMDSGVIGGGKDQKQKETKDETKNRLGNDIEEKADRKWILKEFYKNLAMATNVKRKRESPAPDPQNHLDKLEKIEKKMEEAGDQIIWDALKYTGAHKDAELSPEELSHVKNEIIQKLAAAYSLEKVREAIEEFRQQLGQLKDKQQYY